MAKNKNDTKSTEIASEKPKNEKKSQNKAQKTQKSCLKCDEVPEAAIMYHEGDSLEKIAKELTGKSYMEFAVLNYSGYNMNTLKDGAVLKWRI